MKHNGKVHAKPTNHYKKKALAVVGQCCALYSWKGHGGFIGFSIFGFQKLCLATKSTR